MKRYALSLVFCVLAASATFGQGKTPIEGVWKVAELVMPSENPAEKGQTIINAQPSLIIFTKQYYSGMGTGGQARVAVAPPKDPRNLTDTEKIARYEQWRSFSANAGTYEIKGSTLLMRAIVAKNVEAMTRTTPQVWELKMEGPNILWLIPQSPTEPRVKFTRLE